MDKMQIHATNIHGLGASQVVISFLESFQKKDNKKNTTVYVPNSGLLSEYTFKNCIIKRFKRKLPNGISRFIECTCSRLFFKDIPTIVLGDIPLRGIKDQVVLVHQPNLIKPKINPYSSNNITFKLNRFLFAINQKYAKKIIVQTGAMAKDMIASYPKIKNKIVIAPQPVPNWLLQQNVVNPKKTDKIILFYPAAFYPHKKHDFLLEFNEYCIYHKIDTSLFEIWITLSEEKYEPFEKIKFIKNLGRLNTNEMNKYYRKVNALLFISSMESYGLPLVEALTIKLPILVVEFDYSRWLCEDLAYYFKPYEKKEFLIAIQKLIKDLQNNRKVNYDKALQKFPNSWDDVVSVFNEALTNILL